MEGFSIRRLSATDGQLAQQVFLMMAKVFDEDSGPLSSPYLIDLLGRHDFWALVALHGDEIIGGITAYSLSLTRAQKCELFIYDIAVSVEWRRKGVGRKLISTLREVAATEGIQNTFVFADDEDTHAVEFYRALGGTASPVTAFSFSTLKETS